MRKFCTIIFCLSALGCSGQGCNTELMPKIDSGPEFVADASTDSGPPIDSGPGEFYVPMDASVDSATSENTDASPRDAGPTDAGATTPDSGETSDACVDRHGNHGPEQSRGHLVGVGHGCREPGRPEFAHGPPWSVDGSVKPPMGRPPGRNR